jgi:hypothetical protein
MVMLLGQGSIVSGFAVKAILLVLNSVKDGAKYLVVNLATSGAIKAVRSLKNLVWPPGEESRAVQYSDWQIIEDYSAEHQLKNARNASPSVSNRSPSRRQSNNSNRPPNSGASQAPLISSINHDGEDMGGFQVVECPTDEIDKMVASIHQGKPGKASIRTVTADEFVAALDQSVHDLESSSANGDFPQLGDLADNSKIEWLLSSSMHMTEQSQHSEPAALAANPIDPSLLTSWMEIPSMPIPSAPPLSVDDFEVVPGTKDKMLDDLLKSSTGDAGPRAVYSGDAPYNEFLKDSAYLEPVPADLSRLPKKQDGPSAAK